MAFFFHLQSSGRVGMAGLVHGAAQWFWDPDIWLPPNVTWESFDTTQVVKEGDVIQPGEFARFGDLWYPIPLAVVVMAVRQVVEKFLFKPLGVRLGLKDRARKGPVEKPILEKAFNTYGRGTIDSSILARDTGMTVIQVTTSVLRKTNVMHFCHSSYPPNPHHTPDLPITASGNITNCKINQYGNILSVSQTEFHENPECLRNSLEFLKQHHMATVSRDCM